MIETFRTRLKTWWQRMDVFVVRRAPPQARKGMIIFWIYGFLIAASSAFVDTYTTLYALALGATNVQIGALSSSASFLGMLAPIPGAQWAERWGNRKAVVLIAFGIRRLTLLGAMLLPLILPGQAAIYAVIVCFALRTGLMNLGNPAWVSLSGDIVPQKLRGRYFASRKTVMALASMLFVPLAGQVIEWGGGLRGYRWTFAISIVLGAIALAHYAYIPEPAQPSSRQKRAKRNTFWRSLTENRTFLFYMLIAMIWNFSLQLGGPFFSVYQVQVLNSSPGIIGLLSMASALSRLIGQQFWGRVVDRRGSRWTLTLCTLIIPFLPFLWIPMTKPWHVIFVTVPSGFLWAGHELANFNLLLALPGEPQRTTRAAANYATLVGLANIAGPILGGRIIEATNYHWDFILSGMGRLLAGILFMLLLRPFKTRQPCEG